MPVKRQEVLRQEEGVLVGKLRNVGGATGKLKGTGVKGENWMRNKDKGVPRRQEEAVLA